MGLRPCAYRFRLKGGARVHVLSLCSGIGGLELGVKRATAHAARVVCYVEREAYCISVLQTRMADGDLDDAPIWSDVKTFNPQPWRGIVDLITAGFPCQPFSAAGKRAGDADPRHLWPYILRHIQSIEPALVFCENVPGLLALGFEQVCKDLQGLGYSVEAGIFSAEECGAPHIRKRLFFIAYANGHALRHASRWRHGGADGQGAHVPQFHGHQRDVANAHHAVRWADGAGGKQVGGQDYRVHPGGTQNNGGVGGGGEDVANAHVIYGGTVQESQAGRASDPANGGSHVANPKGARRQARGGHAQGNAAGAADGPTACTCGKRGCIDVADAASPRRPKGLRGTDAAGKRQGGVPQSQRSSLGDGTPTVRSSQPGLGELDDGVSAALDAAQNPWGDGWESGVPRVTDIKTHRTERLRALGNAVVPQTAQLAFETLLRQALDACAQ